MVFRYFVCETSIEIRDETTRACLPPYGLYHLLYAWLLSVDCDKGLPTRTTVLNTSLLYYCTVLSDCSIPTHQWQVPHVYFMPASSLHAEKMPDLEAGVKKLYFGAPWGLLIVGFVGNNIPRIPWEDHHWYGMCWAVTIEMWPPASHTSWPLIVLSTEVAEGMPYECWRNISELSCDKLRVWLPRDFLTSQQQITCEGWFHW